MSKLRLEEKKTSLTPSRIRHWKAGFQMELTEPGAFERAPIIAKSMGTAIFLPATAKSQWSTWVRTQNSTSVPGKEIACMTFSRINMGLEA
jgi:hypothetical protein